MTGQRPAVFRVDGDWYDYGSPPLSGTTIDPTVGVVSAFVYFVPRLPAGFVAYVSNFDVNGDGSEVRDAAIAIPPLQCRIWNGRLSTIDVTDTTGVELMSNDPMLNLVSQNVDTLIYDVHFDGVVYDEDSTRSLMPFAFTAPIDDTPITLTSPGLERLPWVSAVVLQGGGGVASQQAITLSNVPDDVRLTTGGDVQFYSKNVPLGAPLSLTVLTGSGSGGSVTLNDITDVTTVGKALGRATDATTARTAIGAAADAAVAHLGGAETFSGGKNFTGGVLINSNPAATRSISSITSAQVLAANPNNEYYVLCKVGGVPTLPTAVGNNCVYILKNISGSTINVQTTLSQTIEGLSSYPMANNDAISMVSDNVNWRIF